MRTHCRGVGESGAWEAVVSTAKQTANNLSRWDEFGRGAAAVWDAIRGGHELGGRTCGSQGGSIGRAGS